MDYQGEMEHIGILYCNDHHVYNKVYLHKDCIHLVCHSKDDLFHNDHFAAIWLKDINNDFAVKKYEFNTTTLR